MSAILTVQEVAERMRCEHRTVRRAIRSGELEAALIGGKWLVREEAVDDWFRSRCASPKPFPYSPRVRTPRTGSRRPDGTASVERLQAMERRGA
jgi:excisionase family DNA binding protein